ncbi:hypothetical protein TcBrA4_0023650 [Trypanosoma cruzi]|nr:hypothetical protein TcBrA4_0023650 [Trypanosoma cruzi]
MHVDLSDRQNIPQQVWSPRLDDSTVLIKLSGVEMSALTSVLPNFLQLTVCAFDVEGHHAHLFPAGAMPFPHLRAISPMMYFVILTCFP